MPDARNLHTDTQEHTDTHRHTQTHTAPPQEVHVRQAGGSAEQQRWAYLRTRRLCCSNFVSSLVT